jgi:hypothetical protein
MLAFDSVLPWMIKPRGTDSHPDESSVTRLLYLVHPGCIRDVESGFYSTLIEGTAIPSCQNGHAVTIIRRKALLR